MTSEAGIECWHENGKLSRSSKHRRDITKNHLDMISQLRIKIIHEFRRCSQKFKNYFQNLKKYSKNSCSQILKKGKKEKKKQN